MDFPYTLFSHLKHPQVNLGLKRFSDICFRLAEVCAVDEQHYGTGDWSHENLFLHSSGL
jgi:hypothetical protein